jgi:phosphonate transport system permease protein
VTSVEVERPPVAPDPAEPGSVRPPWDGRRITLAVVAVGLAGASLWSWQHLGMTFGGIIDGSAQVGSLLGRMFPPAFGDLDRTIELALETFFIALLGTTIAAVLSVPVAVMAAGNTTSGRAGQALARGLIAVCRAVPDLVFAFIFVRAIGLGVLAGVMAVALHSIGMIGKLFGDAIEKVDEGPREAVRSTGGGRLQDLATAVFPQVQPSWIGTFLYRLDINVRTSVVLGLVGAGGIGLALQASLRALSYRQALGIVIVIAVLVIGVELFSSAMRRSILGDAGIGQAAGRRSTGTWLLDLIWRQRSGAIRAHRGELSAYDAESVRPPWTGERRVRTFYLGLLLVAIAYAMVSTSLSPLDLARGVPEMIEIAGRLFPPSLGGLDLSDLLQPMLVTVAVGFVSTVLATVFAIPIGLLAARNVAPFAWVATTTRVSLVGWRAVPELILAVIFVAAIGLGPVGGTLALTIGSIPFLAKLVADAVEEIDTGPREAVVAGGATRLQETATSVVPQVVPQLVGSVLYVLDVNIRSSTILGIVGGGGIGFLLFNSMRVQQFDVTGAILIMIFVTIYAIEQLSGGVRRLLQ